MHQHKLACFKSGLIALVVVYTIAVCTFQVCRQVASTALSGKSSSPNRSHQHSSEDFRAWRTQTLLCGDSQTTYCKFSFPTAIAAARQCLCVTCCSSIAWYAVLQALLPPAFLLLGGITIFATAEQARFKNYQKHGGGEVTISSLLCISKPTLYSLIFANTCNKCFCGVDKFLSP